jgi:hypothetical protein
MLNIRQIKRLKMLKMDMGWFEFSYFIVRVISAWCVPSLHSRQTIQNRVGTNWEETGTAKGLKSPF